MGMALGKAAYKSLSNIILYLEKSHHIFKLLRGNIKMNSQMEDL
jgi:hypothetical protein